MRVINWGRVIVFPKLTITGYPAEDLLLRKDFIAAANNAIYTLAEQVKEIAIVVGFPELNGNDSATPQSYCIRA